MQFSWHLSCTKISGRFVPNSHTEWSGALYSSHFNHNMSISDRNRHIQTMYICHVACQLRASFAGEKNKRPFGENNDFWDTHILVGSHKLPKMKHEKDESRKYICQKYHCNCVSFNASQLFPRLYRQARTPRHRLCSSQVFETHLRQSLQTSGEAKDGWMDPKVLVGGMA